MTNDEKITAIHQAIRNDKVISFDYVAKDFSISFNRTIHPTELNDTHLWGMDLDKQVLRQFLIDGIMKLRIGIPYPSWKETHED